MVEVKIPAGFVPLNELQTDENTQALQALIAAGMKAVNRDIGDAELQPDLTVTTRSPATSGTMVQGIKDTLRRSKAFGSVKDYDIDVRDASSLPDANGDREYAVVASVKEGTSFNPAAAEGYLRLRDVDVQEVIRSVQAKGAAV